MPATIRKPVLLITLFTCWLSACVEPFNLNMESTAEILTVDATLSDLPQQQHVRIYWSVNNQSDVTSKGVTGLRVEVQVNEVNRITLTEGYSGYYYFPENFRTQVGHNYKLFFWKPDGTPYESTVEQVPEAPAITQIHDTFASEGITDRDGKTQPAHNIYIDVADPANSQNNYVWSWTHWEKQSICASCDQSRYELTPQPGCKPYPSYGTLDYNCNSSYWEIFKNPKPIVMSDVFFNGKMLLNKLITQIPYYSTEGCLIEINQYNVSKSAYQYLKILLEQNQNNGTLVDPPPATIISNVKNMKNPGEKIAGYFMASSSKKLLYWIDRKNATTAPIRYGMLGRESNYERTSPDLQRPPLATCYYSDTRTPFVPDGWAGTFSSKY